MSVLHSGQASIIFIKYRKITNLINKTSVEVLQRHSPCKSMKGRMRRHYEETLRAQYGRYARLMRLDGSLVKELHEHKPTYRQAQPTHSRSSHHFQWI